MEILSAVDPRVIEIVGKCLETKGSIWRIASGSCTQSSELYTETKLNNAEYTVYHIFCTNYIICSVMNARASWERHGPTVTNPGIIRLWNIERRIRYRAPRFICYAPYAYAFGSSLLLATRNGHSDNCTYRHHCPLSREVPIRNAWPGKQKG